MTAVSVEFYLVAGLVVALIGISKAGFAGGVGVLAVPVMSLYVTPVEALAIHMPLLILMDLANCYRYWRAWSRPMVFALLPGAFLGLACGALFFTSVDGHVLKLLVGAMAVFVAGRYFLSTARPTAPRVWRRPFIALAGFICGFAGIVAHAGGPAIKGYLLSQNLDKTMFVGTNSMFFFFLNIFKGAIYAALSQYSVESLQISATLIPFLIVGVLLGFQLHRLISQRLFMTLAYGLLGFAGLRLLWSAAAQWV